MFNLDLLIIVFNLHLAPRKYLRYQQVRKQSKYFFSFKVLRKSVLQLGLQARCSWNLSRQIFQWNHCLLEWTCNFSWCSISYRIHHSNLQQNHCFSLPEHDTSIRDWGHFLLIFNIYHSVWGWLAYKLLAQQENLLVPDYQTGLFQDLRT